MKKQEKCREAFTVRLKQLMYDRSVDQQELAAAIGVRRQTISMYEGGGASPKLDGLAALAEYFCVPCDYLLGLTDIKTPDANMQEVSKKYGLSESALNTIKLLNDTATAGAHDIQKEAKTELDALNAVLSFDGTGIRFLSILATLFRQSNGNTTFLCISGDEVETFNTPAEMVNATQRFLLPAKEIRAGFAASEICNIIDKALDEFNRLTGKSNETPKRARKTTTKKKVA